ncbi:ATP-dependent helicase [Haploplasma modicum]|uniref:ATP-dependent helicase n=1 Tax=Haploplasma modicum TaxID=2150 RepID=UPI0004798682|nr:ATP-dependent helicase [Haploplasma modicum]
MKNFSDEQLKTIYTTSKHTAVIAGAGSGKTTVLTERIKTILEDENETDILAITFTKKAATEMSERINRSDLTVKTFDAFCYEIVTNYLKKDIQIIGKSPFTESELNKFNNYDVGLKIDEKPKKYDDYILFKQTENKMDFIDVEYLALNAIKEFNITYKHILIDEFQDTNELQYLIFKSLITDNTKTFIVGDPDQSIYGFRGANFKLFTKYIEDFSADVKILSNNYRSDKGIISIANNLISYNQNRIEKELKSFSADEGFIYYNKFLDDNLEFEFVQKKYEELKDKYESFAVLYRNNFQGYSYRYYFKEEEFKNVTVSTIHQSKGLEFDVVFIVGVNEGIIPDNKMNKNEDEEEERRLFFVAITRAKKHLYITSSRRTQLGGIPQIQNESKFINETKQRSKHSVVHVKTERKPVIAYLKGDTVIHDKFGEGKVTAVTNAALTIDFNGEVKKISVKYPGISKKN